MRIKLTTASPGEQQAAFNAVYWDLVALVKELPGIAQIPASNKLNSVEGRAQLMKIIDDGLAAAEKYRAASLQKS
jgi:hypothetical protein